MSTRAIPQTLGPDGRLCKVRLRAARAHLRETNRNFGAALVPIPIPATSDDTRKSRPVRAWRSREFLVQEYHENGGIRLSIGRTELKSDGDWKDGISWDDLQRLKNEAGFSDRDAVELYPAAHEVVNIANLRHLWILPESFPWKWRKP